MNSSVTLSLPVIPVATMFFFNLEKSSKNNNVYIVRAATDTLLLSSARNFVFTGVRIKLPDTRPLTTAKLQPSVLSPFIGNRDIDVPIKEVTTSQKNLAVCILNHGPLDIWIKKEEVIAEVVLTPEFRDWKQVKRRPDYRDFFLFGSLCEKMRQQVIKRRRGLFPVDQPDVQAENEDPFEEMLDGPGINWAFMDAYRAALYGEPALMDNYEEEQLPAASGILSVVVVVVYPSSKER